MCFAATVLYVPYTESGNATSQRTLYVQSRYDWDPFPKQRKKSTLYI